MTGTASWALVAASQYIPGIRPDYDGLRIDPCMPSGWPGFRARRVYRGAVYELEVENPDRVSKGVRDVVVDGQVVEGGLIPMVPAGETRSVRVMMGAGQ
jgi:cellobiose phosphorylase